MVAKYEPRKFEKKWIGEWERKKLYSFQLDKNKNKFYNLVELPYTSGDLHIGHWFVFTIPDVLARFKRMNGFNVFFPNGFDAFGLPAENAAIQRKIHPRDWTMKNISLMRKQYTTMGTMINWDSLVITCLPEFYRWNQWIFLKMWQQGLAYRGKALSNWCEKDRTVLANENVENGKCWRCGQPVVQKEVEQWFLKITDYAERLVWLENTNKVDWPVAVRVGQNNWIGRKEGINICYKVVLYEDSPPEIFNSTGSPGQAGFPSRKNSVGLSSKNTDFIDEITCFTTRPDTNFGATFIVLAPEHPFIKKIRDQISKIKNAEQKSKMMKQYEKIEKYVRESAGKSELERIAEGKKKTGVSTGFYAINQLNKYPMPVWISDFVLSTVGTGAVVGVPGHDIRDFEFAQEFNLEVVRVVVGKDGDTSPITRKDQVQEKEGKMINSDFLNGLDIHKATEKMMDYIEKQGWGKRTVTYHLRDWSVSRQRYWGTPVPMVHCNPPAGGCGIVPVPEKDLPVELPYEVDFAPKGMPPLATNEKWLKVKCPKCGREARRDAETLDTFFDSAWYWFRYLNPQYSLGPFDKNLAKKLTPVDVYFGGAEHTLGHTLYARFFTKFFKDLGLVDYDEFALKRIQHGVVLGPDGNRMSKSKGNVINPDDVVVEYGADTVRMYLCFMMPYEATSSWSTTTIAGVNRFLNRVWRMYHSQSQISNLNPSTNSKLTLSEAERVKSQIHNLNLKTSNSLIGQQFNNLAENKDLVSKLYKTIEKVTKDIEKIKMNTAIAAMMEFLNEWERSASNIHFRRNFGSLPLKPSNAKKFLQILSPFAPFITEEIWHNVFGEKDSIHLSPWPAIKDKIIEEEIVIPVQVNGKVRSTIRIQNSEVRIQNLVVEKALKEEKIIRYLQGKKYKTIYVPGKILNFVI